MVQLKLPAETLARVRERAAAAGQDVESFVIEALEDKLAAATPSTPPSAQNSREWKAKFEAWIASHPVVAHRVDDSRESIYADRGK